MLALEQLLAGGRPLEHPLALALDRVYRQGDLLQAAAAVSEHARRQGGQRWLLACEDPWDFLTGLFGLLHAGCEVAIPPNHLPATLERLTAELDGRLDSLAGLLPGNPLALGGIAEGRLAFWTAGSSGEPKRIAKTLAQLDAEVRVLEGCFGSRMQGGPVLGTVPHHHIYGCLFRLLWPLAAGRPVALQPRGDPARPQPLPAGGPAPALVSSPALLARLPRLMDLDALAPLASVAFSSGGPLTATDALAWRRWVPGGVVEIYGSTETGGIAWRVQDARAESSRWTPFPDVSLEFDPDGALRVRSPRVGPQSLRLEDAAEATEGGTFRLLGRLDRIVKLEEKRIALPELEAALVTHPWVQEAALVLLEGARASLGAVLVPTPEGRSALLADRGQGIRALQRHLGERCERVAVPKRWRIVEALPFDARGKLLPQALASLFASHGRAAQGRATLPRILSHQSGEAQTFTLVLDPELLAFQGHFPGNPILPGVVQVDWAIRLGLRAFGPLGGFQGITHLKFMDLIRPGETVELRLSLDPGRAKLRFAFAGASGRKSSGVVLFAASE